MCCTDEVLLAPYKQQRKQFPVPSRVIPILDRSLSLGVRLPVNKPFRKIGASRTGLLSAVKLPENFSALA